MEIQASSDFQSLSYHGLLLLPRLALRRRQVSPLFSFLPLNPNLFDLISFFRLCCFFVRKLEGNSIVFVFGVFFFNVHIRLLGCWEMLEDGGNGKKGKLWISCLIFLCLWKLVEYNIFVSFLCGHLLVA